MLVITIIFNIKLMRALSYLATLRDTWPDPLERVNYDAYICIHHGPKIPKNDSKLAVLQEAIQTPEKDEVGFQTLHIEIIREATLDCIGDPGGGHGDGISRFCDALPQNSSPCIVSPFPSLNDWSLFVVCFKTRKTPDYHANVPSSFNMFVIVVV